MQFLRDAAEFLGWIVLILTVVCMLAFMAIRWL